VPEDARILILFLIVFVATIVLSLLFSKREKKKPSSSSQDVLENGMDVYALMWRLYERKEYRRAVEVAQSVLRASPSSREVYKNPRLLPPNSRIFLQAFIQHMKRAGRVRRRP